ncbi:MULTISPECIES: sigma D regulator [Tenebrionibacter/Tenebrionicola group]|uniref:Regulator of sigma D n=2 Tax=Tenebrionibacter/Tenebrionicola group TaxID=2969848 RepID=A0A8K0V3K3_9ENTR|nr:MULTISPECIES: sigma D regulator [Tenebrionibacter/Tenebrionicola group]MBK4716844.1 sigma D regulator [Tenebrionibacter intestinalis]MBV4414414.1 sigma D regulator [Tenebrionicola larvae]MBV5097399.1 sigma D regulator [Tenebrionicola larvae]
MLNQLKSLTERVGGSNELLVRWLHDRKHLLVAYYSLVGIKPGKAPHAVLNEQALDRFCQNLVDYLSTCHFCIYERITHEMEGTLSTCKIWSKLEANTEQIMAYYDSHLEKAIDHDDYLAFQHALSEIGEALASRFALEDKLIAQMLEKNLRGGANDTSTFARPA